MKTFFYLLFLFAIFLSLTYIIDVYDSFIANDINYRYFTSAILNLYLAVIFINNVIPKVKENKEVVNLNPLFYIVNFYGLILLAVIYSILLIYITLLFGFKNGKELFFQLSSFAFVVSILYYFFSRKSQDIKDRC